MREDQGVLQQRQRGEKTGACFHLIVSSFGQTLLLFLLRRLPLNLIMDNPHAHAHAHTQTNTHRQTNKHTHTQREKILLQ